MRLALALLSSILLAGSVISQQGTQGQFITELKKRETAAKNDPKALVECANYAKSKGLNQDFQRLMNKVLKLDPDNEAAHLGLGFRKYKGKWLLKKDADAAEKSDTEAEMKAKGLEWIEGAWVQKEHAADAKKGIFHYESEVVSKEEYKLLQGGTKVRHPRTGELIDKADAEKAAKQFLLGDGKWGDEAEANKYHSDLGRPWLVRSYHCTLLSNLPFAEIEALKGPCDEAAELLKTLFGEMPSPTHRPVVFVVSGEDYRELGARIGDEGSTYGAFFAAGTLTMPGQPEMRPAVFNNMKDWGPYYARHAVGLAFAQGIAAGRGVDFPLWFERGAGGLAERLYTDGTAAHFGKSHLGRGGVNLAPAFFKNYSINAELQKPEIEHQIYQAGLNLAFSMRAGNKDATAALQALVASFDKGQKAVDAAFAAFEKVLITNEKAMREYLKSVTSKS